MNARRQVITIATGKPLYLKLAVNLARSFFLWHTDNAIRFQLVTDMPGLIPDDIKAKVELIKLKQGEIGEGFSTKLHLDKLISEGQTLFIDSDCLVYRNLNRVFDAFEGYSVSVVGGYIATGEWFGNVAHVCRQFNIDRLPKFNGGVYYLEKGGVTTDLYNKARELEKNYDAIGFKRLRKRPNDEVLIALSMQLHGQVPIADDGSILAEFVNFSSGIKSSLLKGYAKLYNTPGHKQYHADWPLQTAQPAIVHFLGHYNNLLPYLSEVKTLKYVSKKNWPVPAAVIYSFFTVSLPNHFGNSFKNLFRPLLHAVSGPRTIKKSERIID